MIRRRLAAALLAVTVLAVPVLAVTVLSAAVTARSAMAQSSPPGDGSVPSGDVTDPVVLRRAKVGLLTFVAANFDRPDRVTAPCPALTADQVAGLVTIAGLRASTRPLLTTVVWDSSVGSGVVAVHCAQDETVPGKPVGSSSFAMDVVTLDGRASFQQYAVKVGGPDALIGTSEVVPGAQTAGGCSTDKKVCSAAIEVGGVVVTIRLNNLPPATGLAKLRSVLNAAAPLVIASLAEAPGP
jgi:hypothetical protein